MTRLLTSTFSFLSAAALMLGAPQMASAQSASALSGLYACEGISDISAQLSCFRAETAKLRASDPAAPSLAPQKQSLLAAPPVSAPQIATPPVQTPAVQPAASPAPEVKQAAAIVPETKAQASQDEEESFGLIKSQKIKKRTLGIASTETFGRNDYVRFTLENGEVWQQTQAGRFRLKKNEPNVLTIKRASFGSFLGRANDKGQSVRMRRVK